MDSPPAGGKNLRTQIWGGKDRGMQPEAKVKKDNFFAPVYYFQRFLRHKYNNGLQEVVKISSNQN